MKEINLNTGYNVSFLEYPDGQPHVNTKEAFIQEGEEVSVVCSITSSKRLMELLMVADTIDNRFAIKKKLTIPYLMGARFDRIMQSGDSFDLKVIANMINYMNFEKVILFDVHSDVASALLKNTMLISNSTLVEYYTKPDAILVCPDAGAVKKVAKYIEWNKNITDVVYCTKTRDLSNGNLTIKVLEPEKCKDKNCVIIDDLCDGGGTFLGIASQISPAHLTLIVTHGIFSQGYSKLTEVFDQIITSNSYPHNFHEKVLTVNI